MRKIIIIMMALLLPLSAFEMSADNEKAAKKIPLELKQHGKMNRSLIQEPIISYYYGMMTAIQTSVTSDLGVVDVMVTNSSTGESWYDSFDSSEEPQTILQISGEALEALGSFEYEYKNESKDCGTVVLRYYEDPEQNLTFSNYDSYITISEIDDND